MELPVFLLGNNTDHPEDTYIIHLEYPRFVLSIADGNVEWLEDFTAQDEKELQVEGPKFIEQAMAFYERELERYEEE